MTLGSWSLSNINASYASMGVYGGNNIYLSIIPRNDLAFWAIINGIDLSTFGDPGSTIGLMMATRRGKSELEGYYNGAHLGDDTDASYGLPSTYPLYILARNNKGTAGLFYDGILSIILVMDGVTDADALGIYNIFHRYMTRIGQ